MGQLKGRNKVALLPSAGKQTEKRVSKGLRVLRRVNSLQFQPEVV